MSRYGPGDVVVGDYVWGLGAWTPCPVIRVHRTGIVLGVHRGPDGWDSTETLHWGDVRGMLHAVPDSRSGSDYWTNTAANQARSGQLTTEQREALAAMLRTVAQSVTHYPTRVVIAHTIDTLTRRGTGERR